MMIVAIIGLFSAALLILLALAVSGVGPAARKTCSFCRKSAHAKATVCPHCQREFQVESAAREFDPATGLPVEDKQK